MRARASVFILVTLLVLTACVRPAPGVETIPATAQATNQTTAPTEFAPAGTAVATTIPPTFTPALTTPSPAPIPRFTVTPGGAPVSPEATPDPLIAVVKSASTPGVYDAHPSTDGRWVASVVQYPCVQTESGDGLGYEFLRLVNNWERTERVAADQLYACGALGTFGLDGEFWSPGNRYFYFTDARAGVPDGCGYWERPILRLEPESGEIERLGGGPLSPDRTRLATWSGPSLAVWHLDEGALFQLPAAVPDAIRGPIAWSPDGQALAYLQLTALCPPTGPAALVRVNVPAGTQEVLLVAEEPVYDGLAWDTPGTITLFAAGEAWRYDVGTGNLER